MENGSERRASPPTLEDVAREAGVSTATVSRCLTGSGVVRQTTRERIEEAVAKLGYTPNFGARALASKRTGTIGIIIPTMENAIFAHGLQAMEESLSKQDVTLLVATSGYDPEREMEKIKALVARGVDGLALIGFGRSPAVYDFLAARSVRFVLLWNYRADSPYPCIGFDNHQAAADMADRVMAQGHREIAMIGGLAADNDRAAARIAGVRGAMTEQGLDLAPDRLVECRYSLAEGEAAVSRLLSATVPPTAIICGNDVLAVGALRGARLAGLSIPNDLSIVGFDDIELASAVDPALTTVHVPHRRMGRAAAQFLLSSSEGAGEPVKFCFETEIVMRSSLGTASGASAKF